MTFLGFLAKIIVNASVIGHCALLNLEVCPFRGVSIWRCV